MSIVLNFPTRIGRPIDDRPIWLPEALYHNAREKEPWDYEFFSRSGLGICEKQQGLNGEKLVLTTPPIGWFFSLDEPDTGDTEHPLNMISLVNRNNTSKSSFEFCNAPGYATNKRPQISLQALRDFKKAREELHNRIVLATPARRFYWLPTLETSSGKSLSTPEEQADTSKLLVDRLGYFQDKGQVVLKVKVLDRLFMNSDHKGKEVATLEIPAEVALPPTVEYEINKLADKRREYRLPPATEKEFDDLAVRSIRLLEKTIIDAISPHVSEVLSRTLEEQGNIFSYWDLAAGGATQNLLKKLVSAFENDLLCRLHKPIPIGNRGSFTPF